MDTHVSIFTASAEERSARAFSADSLLQIERAFDAGGAVVLRDVFERSFIERLHGRFVGQYRAVYEDPKRRHVEDVGDRRNLTVVEVEGAFNDPDLYANPFAHGALMHLVGEDCIVGQYGSVTSLPGAAHQKPHRDSPWLFGRPATDVSVPPYAITVVIPLVDMHVEGPGTTRVWPRTHREPSDEAAASMPHFDPIVPRGSCLFMDSRLRHGGTGNRSSAPRPIIYMSYQRHWFRDYDGYRVKPPIHISQGELSRVPRAYRHLFAWAQADNTPETLKLAIKRAAKNAVPEPVKAAVRRVRDSFGRER